MQTLHNISKSPNLIKLLSTFLNLIIVNLKKNHQTSLNISQLHPYKSHNLNKNYQTSPNLLFFPNITLLNHPTSTKSPNLIKPLSMLPNLILKNHPTSTKSPNLIKPLSMLPNLILKNHPTSTKKIPKLLSVFPNLNLINHQKSLEPHQTSLNISNLILINLPIWPKSSNLINILSTFSTYILNNQQSAKITKPHQTSSNLSQPHPNKSPNLKISRNLS